MPSVNFQLSQRADFVETLLGPQTTFRRPLINSRDEPLCGPMGSEREGWSPGRDFARLHVISYDSTLCHVSSLLKVGVLQLLLTQIEAGSFSPALTLDDPVEAMHRWSHDPTLQVRARMSTGQELTAVELQFRFLEEAQAFADHHGFDGYVPRSGEILALWEDTLLKLEGRDFPSLAPRLDWVLKMRLIERAMELDPKLGWSSPDTKRLDHLYSSLGLATGLYWKYEQAGVLEPVVSDEEICGFTGGAPEDTRAWTRAALLGLAEDLNLEVEEVDWARLRLRLWPEYWSGSRTVDLDDPLGFTRAEVEPIIHAAETLQDVFDGLHSLASTGSSTAPDEARLLSARASSEEKN